MPPRAPAAAVDPRRASQRSFGTKVDAYRQSASHASRADLDRMLALVGSGRTALDVATGGGHTARALGARFPHVVAVDITRAMLDGLALPCALADAGALPFRDGAFDLVASRIAPHHFPDLDAFVDEAARVLAPGGRLYAFDLTGPDDPARARLVDAIERTRDPSHVRSWSLPEWRAAVEGAGLSIGRLERTASEFELEPWIARAALEPDAEARLRALLARPAAEMDGYGAHAGGRMRVLRVEVLATKKPQA